MFIEVTRVYASYCHNCTEPAIVVSVKVKGLVYEFNVCMRCLEKMEDVIEKEETKT